MLSKANRKHISLFLAILMIMTTVMSSLTPSFHTKAATNAKDLFFSEYVEGSGNNQAIEIYNGTGGTVDLAKYSIKIYQYKDAEVSYTENTLPLAGTLLDGEVCVIYNTNSSVEFQNHFSKAAVKIPDGSVATFDGNDALELYDSFKVIDVIGDKNTNPLLSWTDGEKSTLDQTLIRKANVNSGNITGKWTNGDLVWEEWESHSKDDFTNLGSHTMNASIAITTNDMITADADMNSSTINAAAQNGVVTGSSIVATPSAIVDKSIVVPLASFAGSGKVDSTIVYSDKEIPNDYLNQSAWLTYYKKGVQTIPKVGNNSTLGSSGSQEGDYYQIELSTKLYGNISLSYSMKGSKTGAKNFKLLSSSDGSNWTGATASNFSITKDGTLEKFETTLPNETENLDHIYIRIQVADNIAINGASIGTSGTNYLNDIKITGSPVISEDVVGHPTITPVDGDVRLGDTITMTSSTNDAKIFYSINGGTEQIYDEKNKPTFTSLPATITAYARKEGLQNSLTVTHSYTQEKVAPVKATPNGGTVKKGTKVKLSSGSVGAFLTYSLDGGANWVKYDESKAITLDKLPAIIKAKATLTGCLDSETSEFNYTEKLNDNYNIYFGQLHSHTSYSDGAGSCDDAFNYAKNTAKQIDFLAVTDHSNSFDNADKASLADGSMSSEWVEGHQLADKYTDSNFVGIYGFEMTWSNGLGHINTFNTPGFQSRTQAQYSTYSTALSNYYETLKTNTASISQFNHPGTTFGDFSDFDHYDKEIDNLITLIEVGNGEGAIGSSGYFPSYEYYTRALDKGWHISPTNNQDNHKGYWGDANTARTVVLADSLTRDNINDALRNMRTYATEDNDLEIQYTLNGEVMGTVMNTSPDKAEIEVHLKDPTDSKIGKVEVIVNGGLSIAKETLNTNEGTVKFSLPNDYSYYYIRVTEPDSNIAVTAPVWTGEVESVGVSKISTSAVLPVKGESLNVATELYNNESNSLLINSIEYTVNDKVIHAVDLDKVSLNSLPPLSKNSYNFDYTYNDAGAVSIYVTVKGTLNGTPKVYKSVLKLNYVDPSMVTNVVIDGTHYNDYVTGYYGGNMGNFSKIAADDNIKVNVIKDKITKNTLDNCELLIISAPAKKKGTANAGAYDISHFDDEFIKLVKDYTEKGGTVIVCGIADYQDSVDCQSSKEINKLLEAIGVTTKINSDEAVDDKNNGGQAYRLYLTKYNKNSEFTKGIVENQKYSAYSGCTVALDEKAVNSGTAEYLVKGHDTTYSINSSVAGDTTGVPKNGVIVEQGKTVMLAREKLASGSNVFVSSTVFMSDFEVKAEIDNANDLQYINRNVIENILQSSKKQVAVSKIADVRSGKKGDIFSVEGTVTAGTVSGNSFFDTIYIEDETGGINIFPINEGLIEVGQKVKVVGYLDEYLGDKELRVISASITNKDKSPIKPTEFSTKEAMDYGKNGGKLVKVKGTITDVVKKNGTVETIMVKDNSGVSARIFMDGYILYSDSQSKKLEDIAVVGKKISAIGLVSYDPDGVRLRVRDRSEITLLNEENQSGNNSNTSDNKDNSTTVVIDTKTNTKIITKVTIVKDASGNKVKTTVAVTSDLQRGNVIKTVTETVTTEKEIGSVITSTIETDSRSIVTRATLVANLKALKVTTNKKTVTLNANLLKSALVDASKNTTKNVPLEITIKTPTQTLMNEMDAKDIKEVQFVMTIPSIAVGDGKIEVSKIMLEKSLISSAKKQGDNLTFIVQDEKGKETYSWSFYGKKLKTSKKKVSDVNIAIDVIPVKDSSIKEFIYSNVSEKAKDKGIVLDFKQDGILPDTAKVKVYVGDYEGMKPGEKVYLYQYNDNAKTGTKLKNKARLEEGQKVVLTVDKDGYVVMNVKKCTKYVLLPEKPTTKIIATLFEQISVPKSNTIQAKKSGSINLVLPVDAENAKVTYSTSDKKVASVNKTGNITAKKAGTVVITTTITLNNVTKSYKTKIIVK